MKVCVDLYDVFTLAAFSLIALAVRASSRRRARRTRDDVRKRELIERINAGLR